MAYGQTSSGKTYTLLGEGEAPEKKGILPRFLMDLFGEEGKSQGGEVNVFCSFFEIYNEVVYDLLDESKLIYLKTKR